MVLLRFLGRLLFALAWTALIAAIGIWIAPRLVSELRDQPWPVVVFWCVVGPIVAIAALKSVLQALRWVVTGRNGPRFYVRWGGGGGGGGDGGGGYGG
jgi:hypothetical protein